jgi:hypothetical protein
MPTFSRNPGSFIKVPTIDINAGAKIIKLLKNDYGSAKTDSFGSDESKRLQLSSLADGVRGFLGNANFLKNDEEAATAMSGWSADTEDWSDVLPLVEQWKTSPDIMTNQLGLYLDNYFNPKPVSASGTALGQYLVEEGLPPGLETDPRWMNLVIAARGEHRTLKESIAAQKALSDYEETLPRTAGVVGQGTNVAPPGFPGSTPQVAPEVPAGQTPTVPQNEPLTTTPPVTPTGTPAIPQGQTPTVPGQTPGYQTAPGYVAPEKIVPTTVTTPETHVPGLVETPETLTTPEKINAGLIDTASIEASIAASNKRFEDYKANAITAATSANSAEMAYANSIINSGGTWAVLQPIADKQMQESMASLMQISSVAKANVEASRAALNEQEAADYSEVIDTIDKGIIASRQRTKEDMNQRGMFFSTVLDSVMGQVEAAGVTQRGQAAAQHKARRAKIASDMAIMSGNIDIETIKGKAASVSQYMMQMLQVVAQDTQTKDEMTAILAKLEAQKEGIPAAIAVQIFPAQEDMMIARGEAKKAAAEQENYARTRTAEQMNYERAQYVESVNYQRMTTTEQENFNRLTAAEQINYIRKQQAEQTNYDRTAYAEATNYNRLTDAQRTAFEQDMATKGYNLQVDMNELNKGQAIWERAFSEKQYNLTAQQVADDSKYKWANYDLAKRAAEIQEALNLRQMTLQEAQFEWGKTIDANNYALSKVGLDLNYKQLDLQAAGQANDEAYRASQLKMQQDAIAADKIATDTALANGVLDTDIRNYKLRAQGLTTVAQIEAEIATITDDGSPLNAFKLSLLAGMKGLAAAGEATTATNATETALAAEQSTFKTNLAALAATTNGGYAKVLSDLTAAGAPQWKLDMVKNAMVGAQSQVTPADLKKYDLMPGGYQGQIDKINAEIKAGDRTNAYLIQPLTEARTAKVEGIINDEIYFYANGADYAKAKSQAKMYLDNKTITQSQYTSIMGKILSAEKMGAQVVMSGGTGGGSGITATTKPTTITTSNALQIIATYTDAVNAAAGWTEVAGGGSYMNANKSKTISAADYQALQAEANSWKDYASRAKTLLGQNIGITMSDNDLGTFSSFTTRIDANLYGVPRDQYASKAKTTIENILYNSEIGGKYVIEILLEQDDGEGILRALEKKYGITITRP